MNKPSANMWFLEMGLVLTLFTLISTATAFLQPPLSLNGGRGWDGVHYYKMAEDFREERRLVGDLPFVYRIGTPWLASLVPTEHLVNGFKLVNLIAGVVICLLLLVFSRFAIRAWPIRVAVVALYLIAWHAPPRFTHFYPVTVDAWAMVFTLLGMIFIQRYRIRRSTLLFGALCLTSLVGVMFREVALLVPLAFPFVGNPVRYVRSESVAERLAGTLQRLPPQRFVPLLFGVTGALWVRNVVEPAHILDYSFVDTVITFSYQKPLQSYVHAWFIAYGPVLVLLIYSWRDALGYLRRHQDQAVFLLGVALFGLVGGTDTERILFWGMPVVLMLIGRSAEQHLSSPQTLSALGFNLVLLAGQLVSQRVFWSIPDYPNSYPYTLPVLTPLGSHFPYLNLYSYHGLVLVNFLSLIQYLGLTLCLLLWLGAINRRSGTNRLSARREHDPPPLSG